MCMCSTHSAPLELDGVNDPGVIRLSGICDAADGVQELAFAAKQRRAASPL